MEYHNFLRMDLNINYSRPLSLKTSALNYCKNMVTANHGMRNKVHEKVSVLNTEIVIKN